MNQLSAIKQIHESGGFDVGSRQYTFAKMPYKIGKKIFAYLTVVASDLEAGNMGFIDSDKFEKDIEPLLMKYVLIDGFKLDTVPDHFDEYPGDYMQFVMMSLQGFAAPFLPESATNSHLTEQDQKTVTLKKPM